MMEWSQTQLWKDRLAEYGLKLNVPRQINEDICDQQERSKTMCGMGTVGEDYVCQRILLSQEYQG